MRITLRLALIGTVCATIVFLAGLALFAVFRESQKQIPAQQLLDYSKLYVEAFKVIVISFFIALVGILLPALSREIHYDFEKRKASRAAYSEAKTGVNYLPLHLCTLAFSDAAAVVQRVHFQKHQAELYEELRHWLAHFDQTPDDWGDEMYFRLIGFRTVLEQHSHEWDDLKPPERLKLLLESRASLDKDFPPS